MADPQHIAELDDLDRLTVRIYRLGFWISAAGLLGLAACLSIPAATPARPAAEALILGGAAASIANMHLYDKRIRWVIGAAGWVGAVLLVISRHAPAALEPWGHHAGLGFVFVTLSAFALKEQFCFKIPGLRLVPALLALSLIPMLMDQGVIAALLLGIAGVIYGALAVAKARMPLHYDIGNKAAYQI